MIGYITGVGTSNFGKQPDVPLETLAWDAVAEALTDAGVDDLDAVYVGTVFGAPGVAQRILSDMGIVGVPIVTVENACASGTTAFYEALRNVSAGDGKLVLALGIEQLSPRFDGPIQPEPSDYEGSAGFALPAVYAMIASRYLHRTELTVRQLAAISVKNHANARGNPRAQYAGTYTVEDVLASPMISDPLTLLQCCPLSDGAAAAIVSRERRSARDVGVLAAAIGSGGLWDHRSPSVWGFGLVERVARDAYGQARLQPGDIDFAEVHDAFTIGEVVSTEAIGLASEGTGGRLVDDGHTWLGGPQPVNPSGGLLSRGHPLGATGVAQVAEATWQLRGEAGARQVSGARVGMVETMGGGVAGIDGNACVVAILTDR